MLYEEIERLILNNDRENIYKLIKAKNDYYSYESIIYEIVRYNKINIVKYLYENGCPCYQDKFIVDKSLNKMDVKKYKEIHECIWNYELIHYSLINKAFDVFLFLYRNNCETFFKYNSYTLYYKYVPKDKTIKNFLKENCSEYNKIKLYRAIKKGQIVYIKKIYNQNNIFKRRCITYDWDCIMMKLAIKYNHINIVKYMIETEYPIAEDLCEYCIEYNNLDILKYFCNELNISIFDKYIYSISLYKKNIDMIKFIENKFNYNYFNHIYDIVKDNLYDIFLYLHNKYNPSEEEIKYIFYYNRKNMLQYLINTNFNNILFNIDFLKKYTYMLLRNYTHLNSKIISKIYKEYI
jgi:hypothetical protein